MPREFFVVSYLVGEPLVTGGQVHLHCDPAIACVERQRHDASAPEAVAQDRLEEAARRGKIRERRAELTLPTRCFESNEIVDPRVELRLRRDRYPNFTERREALFLRPQLPATVTVEGRTEVVVCAVPRPKDGTRIRMRDEPGEILFRNDFHQQTHEFAVARDVVELDDRRLDGRLDELSDGLFCAIRSEER